MELGLEEVNCTVARSYRHRYASEKSSLLVIYFGVSWKRTRDGEEGEGRGRNLFVFQRYATVVHCKVLN